MFIFQELKELLSSPTKSADIEQVVSEGEYLAVSHVIDEPRQKALAVKLHFETTLQKLEVKFSIITQNAFLQNEFY